MTRNPAQSVTKIAKPGAASMLRIGLAEGTFGNPSIAGTRLGRHVQDSVVRIQVVVCRGPTEVWPEIENGMGCTTVFAKREIL